MQATDQDLLLGALALAYAYVDLPTLREAFKVHAKRNGSALIESVAQVANLSEDRTDKLRRAADVADALRCDAVYGMVAIRNRLVGPQMLNACMEEARREGHTKRLPAILKDRGLLNDTQARALEERQQDLLPELLGKEHALAATLDLEGDREDMAEAKLSAVLGEVAAKISFLNKDDLNQAIRAQRRIEQGLPPEEPEPEQPAQAPAPEPAMAIPVPQPGQAQASADQDPIKGYELLLKLGQGAMGAVLKARKRDSGEIVALKILKPELAGDREYVERFLREAKAVARMAHNNIIRAIQAGRSGEYYYFAMEFIEGQTCDELIKAKGALPERFALMVVRCIASALSHAWEHQIVHRDIKPDNIMITKDGNVKLTDLGLARTAKQDSSLTITGVVMGSPAYISPEQATGEKNLDTRSDIYSLGASLYHMLAGSVPFEAETPLHVMLMHMNEPVPDIRGKAPTVSEATRLFLNKMMAKRPESRFQHPLEVETAARAIEDALARGVTPPIPPGILPPQPQPQAQPQPQPQATPQPQPRPAAPTSESSEDVEGAGDSSTRKRRAFARTSEDRKFGTSSEGRSEAKDKEIGERLRRMAKKRKRRF